MMDDDMLPKIAAGILLLALGTLFLLAILAFLQDRFRPEGSLDALPAEVIQAAVDAATGGE